MPSIHVEKSIDIHAPKEKLFDTLNNFNHWQAWSPWLIMEPKAKVDVSKDNKFYSWEGNRIGSGEMKITEEDPNEHIKYSLTFLKPWKSKADVQFNLEISENGTKVTWLMDSSLPFFMFWMKNMITAFIEMDYERGLYMLKDYAESYKVPSKIESNGNEKYPGCEFVGIRTECGIKDIGPKMIEDYNTLNEWAKNHSIKLAAEPFSIYHKWDMVKKQVAYTSGIPVNEVPGSLPGGMQSGKIPATPVYTITHTGPYRHLGNAWSTGYNMKQHKEFKINKKIDAFETYINGPHDTPENDLITKVHFPVKL